MKGFQIHPKLIYTLSHPKTGNVVYVGSTQNLYARLVSHLNNPSELLKPWIDDLKSKMLVPLIKEVDNLDGDTENENFWIQYYELKGCKLFNKNGTFSRNKGINISKRNQKRNIHVSTEIILHWKSIYTVEDTKYFRFHNVKLGVILNTGFGRPDDVKAITEYFKLKKID